MSVIVSLVAQQGAKKNSGPVPAKVLLLLMSGKDDVPWSCGEDEPQNSINFKQKAHLAAHCSR